MVAVQGEDAMSKYEHFGRCPMCDASPDEPHAIDCPIARDEMLEDAARLDEEDEGDGHSPRTRMLG